MGYDIGGEGTRDLSDSELDAVRVRVAKWANQIAGELQKLLSEIHVNEDYAPAVVPVERRQVRAK